MTLPWTSADRLVFHQVQRFAVGSLEDITDPQALPDLLPLLLAPRWQAPVAQLLQRLLDQSRLFDMDALLRRWPEGGGELAMRWQTLSPREVLGLSRQPEGRILLRVLCSHSSGRVRETAVRQLAQLAQEPQDLDALLVRCGDWVAPVREAAAAALDRRTADGWPEGWLPLSLLLALGRLKRDGVQPIHGWLLERLAASPLLQAAWHSSDADTRRAALRLAVCNSSEWTFRALDSGDQSLIQIGLRALPQLNLSTEEWSALLRHPVPRVRQLALRHCPEAAPELLLDPSARVQEEALSLLRASGELPSDELARRFREALAQPHPLPALRGLRQVGGPDDAAACLPFLFAGGSGVRLAREALLSVAHLDPARAASQLVPLLRDERQSLARLAARCLGRLSDPPATELLAALRDPRPPVAREAARSLTRVAGRLLPRLLMLARDAEAPPLARELALDLAERGSKWGCLPLLVELAAHPLLGPEVERVTRRWWAHYNRRQVPPSPDDLAWEARLPRYPAYLSRPV